MTMLLSIPFTNHIKRLTRNLKKPTSRWLLGKHLLVEIKKKSTCLYSHNLFWWFITCATKEVPLNVTFRSIWLHHNYVTLAAMSGSSKCSLQITRVRLKISKSGLFVLHNFSIICHAAPLKTSFKYIDVKEVQVLQLRWTLYFHLDSKSCVILHEIIQWPGFRICHFWVAFCKRFKMSPSAKPFISK